VTRPADHSGPFQSALAVLESIARSGLVIVPVEPTAAMIEAGALIGRLDPEQAARVWRAMVRAESDPEA